MKKRIPYIIALVILIAVECFIAVFFEKGFIRFYLGDVIVVWAVYALVQTFLAGRFSSYKVTFGVFVFACMVEVLQYIHIVDLIGLGHIKFFRILIGTKAEILDIICYGAGALILAAAIFLWDKLRSRRVLTQKDE